MKIETKFNERDTVWVRYINLETKKHFYRKMTIYRIDIWVADGRIVKDYALVDEHGRTDIRTEEDCFGTKEQAEEFYSEKDWEKEYDKMKEDCIKKALEKFEKEWGNED